MKRPFLAAFAAALLLVLPGTAQADERILQFLSDVQVERAGDLDVTETIRIRSEGDQIKHGIFRDFPTTYRNRLGRQVRVGFQLIDVTRDGSPEESSRSSLSNGVRILIGKAEEMLAPGEHVYTIHYRTTRQIGFFDRFDELYWNATGNAWLFPIDLAEARVRLPQPVDFGERAVYTGAQGSTATNAAVVAERPGEILFRTSAPLAPNEGFTIAVAWPKGVVTPPAANQKLGWLLADDGPFVAAGLGLIAIISYYIFAWRRAGRDPEPGTIVPIFAPPDGLSAAAMRYLQEMSCDNRAFAAALVELGVRGKLRLEEGEKPFFGRAKTTVVRTGEEGDLPPAERAMFASLFSGGDSVLMVQSNHKKFSGARGALAASFKSQFDGKMFLRNVGWALPGIGLLFLSVWFVALFLILADPSGVYSGPKLMLPLGSLAAFAAAAMLFVVKPQSSAFQMFLRILGALAALAGGFMGFITIGLALESGRIVPLLLPLLSLPVVISAFWWMAAPTKAGRAVLDRIAGFRQYLSITEEERLDRMHPPEKTPALFEKYLPYAIALEVENEWAARFASVLAAASAADQTQAMTWYSGHSDPWTHPGDFADQVGSSLASTVASASTAPGSSSGSGGGGSSGGGGGGGGGGGW